MTLPEDLEEMRGFDIEEAQFSKCVTRIKTESFREEDTEEFVILILHRNGSILKSDSIITIYVYIGVFKYSQVFVSVINKIIS